MENNNTATPVYKRVLIKLSGEALAGGKGTGLDFVTIRQVCDVIKRVADMGVGVGLVIGGGNFWRGVKNGTGKMERSRADQMGMLATVMNSIAVSEVLEQAGASARVMSAVPMETFAESYNYLKAEQYIKEGKVVIFAAGTGHPYFSTDTGAVLRAAQMHADAILLAKNVDGVYTADPAKDPTAVRFDSITYEEVLTRRLAVMDSTATSIAMDNQIPLMVFELKDPENIMRVVTGEKIGTLVYSA